jgi:plasmid stabilization system protein ParE
VIVYFRDEARAQAAARRAWWVENRPAASALFDEELESALRDLAERPASIPVLLVRDELAIRRWLLPKTRCHIYYVIDASRGVVEILSLWGASMGRRPPLAKAPR